MTSPVAPPGGPGQRRPPSLAMGFSLLTTAAALIVIVAVNPAFPSVLRVVIAVIAVAVVIALLIWSFFLFRTTQRWRDK